MDDHISFLRTVCRLHDKGLSSKTVWQKLIQKWAFRSIQNDIDQGFEEIYPKWVLSVRKRILYQVRENSVRQKIISTSNNPLCGHLIVNKTALVWKKPRGRPPYQANKQLVSKADGTAFPEIHPELPQLRDISDLCGNCRWDWSKYVIWSVATFHEVLFRHLTGKGTLKAGVTADLDPSSQIWIPLPNFSFNHRFYHIW